MVMVTVVMIDGDDDDAPFPGQHGDDLGHSGQVVMIDGDDDADNMLMMLMMAMMAITCSGARCRSGSSRFYSPLQLPTPSEKSECG